MAHLVLFMLMIIVIFIPVSASSFENDHSESHSFYLVRKFKDSSKKKFTDEEIRDSPILNRNERNVENKKQARTVSTKETLNETVPCLEPLPIIMTLTKKNYGGNPPTAAALIGTFARSQHEEESMAIDTPLSMYSSF